MTQFMVSIASTSFGTIVPSSESKNTKYHEHNTPLQVFNRIPWRFYSDAETCRGDIYYELSCVICDVLYFITCICWSIYWNTKVNSMSNKSMQNKSLQKQIHYCKTNYTACHTEYWLKCGMTSSAIQSRADCYFLKDVQVELASGIRSAFQVFGGCDIFKSHIAYILYCGLKCLLNQISGVINYNFTAVRYLCCSYRQFCARNIGTYYVNFIKSCKEWINIEPGLNMSTFHVVLKCSFALKYTK
jgi:hypothetical protein